VVNDLHRLDLKGRGSYDATVAGLRMLQKAAAQGRISSPGLLSVINPFADGAKVYRHFVDDLGVTHMNFLTPDYTWDSVIPEPVIRGVERFLAAMVDPKAMELVHTYRDDYRSIVGVSSNGDLGPEDTLRTADPRFASMGLNVANNDLRDLLESSTWQEQADAVTIKPDKCKSCDWWKICKAGRPIHRFSKARGFNNHSLYCAGLKDMYAELGAFLVRNGTPLSDIALRLAS
jgi:uncharacterized protein